ncbi:hypothetical protein [Coleofasciculus sp. F4-SAH-05]|uniref:hypothetical protein n=1 Tax=Coleofasciculus TaxID=669368 RepID=UPI0033007C00
MIIILVLELKRMPTAISPIRLAGSSHVFSSPPASRRAMARLYIAPPASLSLLKA